MCRLRQLLECTLGVFLLLVFSAIALPSRTSAGDPVPVRLELADLDGDPRSVSGYSGKVVVVNFWATWCIPCREEMPMLEEVFRDYSGRGVEFIAASTDEESTQALIPEAIEEAGVTFNVWTGATTLDMKRFDVGTALPATAVLDRDGSVAFRLLGVVSEPELRTQLDWLLGDRSSAAPQSASPTEPVVDECCAHDEEGADEHGDSSDGDAVVDADAHDHDHDHDHAHDHGDAEASVGDASLVPS